VMTPFESAVKGFTRRSPGGRYLARPTRSIDTITPKNRRSIENEGQTKEGAGLGPRATSRILASRVGLLREACCPRPQDPDPRAKDVIAGDKTARTSRFVKTTNGTRSLDETSLARARRLVGLKGCVTNIPGELMPAGEVIASYHDLWRVEQSFRMSKTDLRARPMFHHTRDAIEAHLTIVFAALAVARHLQEATGLSIRKIVQILRPFQQITVRIAGH